jgi:hypothetical protein
MPPWSDYIRFGGLPAEKVGREVLCGCDLFHFVVLHCTLFCLSEVLFVVEIPLKAVFLEDSWETHTEQGATQNSCREIAKRQTAAETESDCLVSWRPRFVA